MANLDAALRDWSEQHAAKTADIERLAASIQQRIAAEAEAVADVDCPVEDVVTVQHVITSTERPDGWLSKWGSFAAVACVFLLIGMSIGRRLDRTDGDASADLASSSESSALLLKELDRLFEGRWTSIGEVNGQTFVEASNSDVVDAQSRPRVAVNLVAVERRANESRWRVVWRAAVVTRSEEWVRVPTRITGEDSVAVWAYALPDGAVMVESEVALRGENSIAVSTGKLFPKSAQQRTRPVELWTERRSDRELRVLEATELLML